MCGTLTRTRRHPSKDPVRHPCKDPCTFSSYTFFHFLAILDPNWTLKIIPNILPRCDKTSEIHSYVSQADDPFNLKNLIRVTNHAGPSRNNIFGRKDRIEMLKVKYSRRLSIICATDAIKFDPMWFAFSKYEVYSYFIVSFLPQFKCHLSYQWLGSLPNSADLLIWYSFVICQHIQIHKG